MLFYFVCKLVIHLNLILSFILGNAQIPIGRGAVRGRQPIENVYYRVERPESSKTNAGKQGIVYNSIVFKNFYY